MLSTKSDILKVMEEPLRQIGEGTPPAAMDISDVIVDTIVSLVLITLV